MKTYRDLKLTLRYNTQLNSKFWVGESMKPEVREGLIRIAEEWAEFICIYKQEKRGYPDCDQDPLRRRYSIYLVERITFTKFRHSS